MTDNSNSIVDKIKERLSELEDAGLPPTRSHIHESHLLNHKCKECENLQEQRDYYTAIPFIKRELQQLLQTTQIEESIV